MYSLYILSPKLPTPKHTHTSPFPQRRGKSPMGTNLPQHIKSLQN